MATRCNYLSPLAVAAERPGRGHGAVAVSPIPRGTIVAAFGGTTADLETLAASDPDRRARSIQIDIDTFLLGPPIREPGDSLNHSCRPNCAMRNATQVVTLRDVEIGEELTYDYAMSDTAPYDEFDCRCGSPDCRGRISASDWALPESIERHAGHRSPHVERLLCRARLARPLRKSEAVRLLSEHDDGVNAPTAALRIVYGMPHASWEILVGELDVGDAERASLLRVEPAALDHLVALLNETRSIPRRQRVHPLGESAQRG